MSDATSDKALPSGLRLLGWLGVLPFAAALLIGSVWPAWTDIAVASFIGYGAVILSFLGGARWGRGLAADRGLSRYIESVLPSLLGFSALLLAPQPFAALMLLATGFTVWLLIDFRDALWPLAYKRMRAGITAAVVVMHTAWWLI